VKKDRKEFLKRVIRDRERKEREQGVGIRVPNGSGVMPHGSSHN